MPIACPACGSANPEGARFCSACGSPLASTAPVSERRMVSILFADLAGFTARSDHADPEDVRGTLLPFHSIAKEEIERFGGVVDKFIGDAVLGVFGAPVAHEDDAERAVRAALRIQDRIASRNAEGGEGEVTVRAAVNSGEAVVTFASGPQVGESIAGDVVNTASRLQAVAPPGGVVVGEATFRLARNALTFEALEPVTVKGKSEPLSVWLAVAAAPAPTEEAREAPPFVGRSRERSLLRELYALTMHHRSPHLVTVVGEPGIGKSRLVADLREHVEKQPDSVTWRGGRCLPYGEGITFWALGTVVKAEAGILESDDRERAAIKLSTMLRRLPVRPDEREWLSARLRPLLGLEETGVEGVSSEESYAAWLRFFESVAVLAPTVVVFEDLHFADPAMLQFADRLVDQLTAAPLLLICTTRPELFDRHPSWGSGKPNATAITLSPLERGEVDALLDDLLGEALLPAGIRASLAAGVGGNPLFALEFARMIEDRGAIPPEAWPLGSGPVPVPGSVQALIASRLDLLTPPLRSLVQDAAVAGETFWSGALAAMTGGDGERKEADIRELVRRGLIRRAAESSMEGQVEYAFTHALIRDVAYGQIPRAGRLYRHLAMARWMESIVGDRVADRAELLAFHYGQALDLARTSGSGEDVVALKDAVRTYHVMAGDRAVPLDARQADAHFAEALRHTPDDHPLWPSILFKAAREGWRDGRLTGPEAIDTYERSIEGFRRVGDPVGAAEAMLRMSFLLGFRGETAKAERALEEAVHLLEGPAATGGRGGRDPGPVLARAYNARAEVEMFAGHSKESLAWARKGLSLSRQHDRVDLAVAALHVVGNARCELGDSGGLDDLREALAAATEVGYPDEILTSHAYLGEWLWNTEGPASALDLVQTGIGMTERRGMVGQVMWVKGESLWMLFDAGRWDQVLEVAAELKAWDASEGETQLGVPAMAYRARVLALRGDLDEPSALGDRFLPRARSIAELQVLTPALASAAQVAHLRGDRAGVGDLVGEYERSTRGDAGAYYRAWELPTVARAAVWAGRSDMAEAMIGETRAPATRHRTCVLAAEAVVAEARGELEAAAERYDEAGRAWESFGNPFERSHALMGQARCLQALGRAEAAPLLAAADEGFKRLGLPGRVEADSA